MLGRRVTDAGGLTGEVVDTLSPASEYVLVQWDDDFFGTEEVHIDALYTID